jgi:hypothetical protein
MTRASAFVFVSLPSIPNGIFAAPCCTEAFVCVCLQAVHGYQAPHHCHHQDSRHPMLIESISKDTPLPAYCYSFLSSATALLRFWVSQCFSGLSDVVPKEIQ